MREVQPTIEEVSRSKVFKNGYHVSLHHMIIGRHSMLLDVYAEGTKKIKTTDEVREMIENMSLNEYRAHTKEGSAPKKKGMLDLNTKDALLASKKLLNIQLETMAKRLASKKLLNIQLETMAKRLEAREGCEVCSWVKEL